MSYKLFFALLFILPTFAHSEENKNCDACAPDVSRENQCKSMAVCISHCGMIPKTYQNCFNEKFVDKKTYDAAMAMTPSDDWLCAPCSSAPDACAQLEACKANCKISPEIEADCQKIKGQD